MSTSIKKLFSVLPLKGKKMESYEAMSMFPVLIVYTDDDLKTHVVVVKPEDIIPGRPFNVIAVQFKTRDKVNI